MIASEKPGKLITENIMKTILISITVGFVAIAAMAQNKADIEVSYTASTVNFKEGVNSKPNQYILLANAKESKFYSPTTEYIDSLRSTPEGEAKYKEMTRNAYSHGKFEEMPRRDGSYYVVKSMENNSMTYYDVNGLEKYLIEEEIPDINWELVDSYKTILGYECQMAETDFHGRKWTVWFTTEIPIMNGPWKLGGVPGLILEASDNSGLYTFIATGIQQTTRPILPVYSADSYEKISRQEFLKAKRKFIDNPISQMNAQLSGLRISIGTGGDELRYLPREKVDFIETDY